MSTSPLPWMVPVDVAATLLTLARDLDRGAVEGIERIRATWAIRRLAELLPAERREPATVLLARLDPAGDVPPEPDIIALRSWLRFYLHSEPWGSLARLARAADLHSVDISKLRAGGPMAEAKCERLAAALVAAGTIKAGGAR